MLHSLESPSATADVGPQEKLPVTAAPHRFQEIRHAGILVSDEDPRVVVMIKAYLRMDGFRRLYSTGSAAEVLPLAVEVRPDLIMFDVRMPERIGVETLQGIRAHPDLAATPILILVGNYTSEAKLEVLRFGATDLLSKPLHDAELLARTRNVLAAKIYQDRLNEHSKQLEAAVRARTSELEIARRQLIQCLARAAEYRDDDTGYHIMRVGRYARVIGEELGLTPEALDLLEPAAQLHDIGKIGIPDDVLLKPGKLTPEEYALIQKHCGFGKKIIDGRAFRDLPVRDLDAIREHTEMGAKIMDIGESSFLDTAKRVALTHHECWDGSGYPVGLAGEDIPIEGRIVAVADVFDALSSRRPYKPPFPLEKCFRTLHEGRGTQFDPEVIDAFFRRRDDIIRIQIDFADVD